MTFREFLHQAQRKGESLKDEIAHELFRSKFIKELTDSDFFSKTVARVVKTRDDISKLIRQNMQIMLKLMDVPSHNEIAHLKQKISQMEKEIDRAGKRAITVKSLRNIEKKKAARKKEH